MESTGRCRLARRPYGLRHVAKHWDKSIEIAEVVSRRKDWRKKRRFSVAPTVAIRTGKTQVTKRLAENADDCTTPQKRFELLVAEDNPLCPRT